MSRFFILFAALAAATSATSQGLSNCHLVIGTTGKSANESGLNYAYTIGEPVVMTFKKQGVNVVLTQGFHQPDVCLPVTSTDPEVWTNWDIQVYPNPVVEWLTVQYSAPVISELTAFVISTDGKIVINDRIIPASGSQIDVSGLQAGLYFLQLRDAATGSLSTVRFIKN